MREKWTKKENTCKLQKNLQVFSGTPEVRPRKSAGGAFLTEESLPKNRGARFLAAEHREKKQKQPLAV